VSVPMAAVTMPTTAVYAASGSVGIALVSGST
jgi:hypothetical protein